MASYYDNTWEYKDHKGSKHLHINEDLSMQIKLNDDRVFDGTWTIGEKEVCFFVGEDKSCFIDLLNRSPGETWTGMHDGAPYTGILHKGREAFPAAVQAD